MHELLTVVLPTRAVSVSDGFDFELLSCVSRNVAALLRRGFGVGLVLDPHRDIVRGMPSPHHLDRQTLDEARGSWAHAAAVSLAGLLNAEAESARVLSNFGRDVDVSRFTLPRSAGLLYARSACLIVPTTEFGLVEGGLVAAELARLVGGILVLHASESHSVPPPGLSMSAAVDLADAEGLPLSAFGAAKDAGVPIAIANMCSLDMGLLLQQLKAPQTIV